MTLHIVTATTDPVRSAKCRQSWQDHAAESLSVTVVENGRDGKPYLGSVPAFRQGMDEALRDYDADIYACLHDDVEILEQDWDLKVIRHVTRHPACGLLGFGGAVGLADENIYQTPYNPMQLARKGFRSNLVDAEVHGVRSLLAERVACLDGFSQVGVRAFWEGQTEHRFHDVRVTSKPWHLLAASGMLHHAYDSALGVIAAQRGWEAWYLPVRCRHYGGATAVGDQGYQKWAEQQTAGGDHGFWIQAHQALYDLGRGTLPIRL